VIPSDLIFFSAELKIRFIIELAPTIMFDLLSTQSWQALIETRNILSLLFCESIPSASLYAFIFFNIFLFAHFFVDLFCAVWTLFTRESAISFPSFQPTNSSRSTLNPCYHSGRGKLATGGFRAGLPSGRLKVRTDSLLESTWTSTLLGRHGPNRSLFVQFPLDRLS
jgi:hypothetical protein